MDLDVVPNYLWCTGLECFRITIAIIRISRGITPMTVDIYNNLLVERHLQVVYPQVWFINIFPTKKNANHIPISGKPRIEAPKKVGKKTLGDAYLTYLQTTQVDHLKGNMIQCSS